MNEIKKIGRKYKFFGRVQGVNFRFTTLQISKNFPVTGYVKNLDDGSVELLVYGKKEDVEDFVDDVRNYFKRNITNFTVEEVPYSTAYTKFSIEY